MTSETKVPMPEPLSWAHDKHSETEAYLPIDVLRYGDRRASERDAFWMAKVAELEMALMHAQSGIRLAFDAAEKKFNDEVLLHLGHHDACITARLAEHVATLTNPRAGETA